MPLSSAFSATAIECALQSLKARKALIDFDTLGRTLAYSPFMPRIERSFFVRESGKPPKIAQRVYIESTSFSIDALEPIQRAYTLEEQMEILGHFQAYMLDLCEVMGDSHTLSSPLESIALLRRHSRLPIIHSDIFLDEYQILESALFGADTLLIPAQPLSAKSLSKLLVFARRLSFEPFIGVRNKDELKMAIFSGASMLFIPQDAFVELLSLVPNTQVIATDYPDEYGVDMWIQSENV
ncbi:indole-3-glycerol phosphate synthase [Helicobacter sp. MIT 21-1697]|uniref:indole-3-glycerol phosphate synthase n=1 Tax=Helicobacter sp. MIT 21-1697 TaxID=2993733 RepID=UPI00224B9156|nr:indole-3-glycerol phosphate synthase [Helicobacter sp. MIT 21-1697]MCX2717770.1 indole-3-glycerol phosphate synthase [Helicobacter sp. MIT 21-1697]